MLHFRAMHDPMPAPSGWHNSSMPLATVRAPSITDSHNDSTRPRAPDFQLAAIPHTPAKTHQEMSDLTAEYCVTDASRRQEPEDINDEDAKCRALAQLSTQQHLREGFLWCTMSCRQAQGLLCHFKLIRVRSDSKFLPYSLQWRTVQKQVHELQSVSPYITWEKDNHKIPETDIWEVWRSRSDRLLTNRSELYQLSWTKFPSYRLCSAGSQHDT